MTHPHPKNPAKPAAKLITRTQDIYYHAGPLWRIHQTSGVRRTSWNTLRHFGPLQSFRWEPHPPPQSDHVTAAVLYTAGDYITTFGEVFQGRRGIHLTDQRSLTAWYPARDLKFLDLSLSNNWCLINGSSASLPYAGKNICRGWAQAIWDELGDEIDGICVPSTITGWPVFVLFSRAADSFPLAPEFSRPLSHLDVATLATHAADHLSWPIV